MKFLRFLLFFLCLLSNESFSVAVSTKILAKIGGKIITNLDLEERLRLAAFINGVKYSEDFYKKFRGSTLHDLIFEVVYSNFAEENGMKIDENVVLENAQFFFKFKEKKNLDELNASGIRIKSLLDFTKSKIIMSSINSAIAKEFDVRLNERLIKKIANEKKRMANTIQYGVLEVDFYNNQNKIKSANEFLKNLKEEKNPDEKKNKFIEYFFSRNGIDCDFKRGLKWIPDNFNNNYSPFLKNLSVGDCSNFLKVQNKHKLFMLIDKKGGGNISFSDVEVSIFFVMIPVGISGINNLGEEKVSQINKIMLSCFNVEEIKEVAKTYNLQTRTIERRAIDLPEEIKKLNINQKFGPSIDGENILIGVVVDKKNINNSDFKKEDIINEFENNFKSYEVQKIINKKKRMIYVKTFTE